MSDQAFYVKMADHQRKIVINQKIYLITVLAWILQALQLQIRFDIVGLKLVLVWPLMHKLSFGRCAYSMRDKLVPAGTTNEKTSRAQSTDKHTDAAKNLAHRQQECADSSLKANEASKSELLMPERKNICQPAQNIRQKAHTPGQLSVTNTGVNKEIEAITNCLQQEVEKSKLDLEGRTEKTLATTRHRDITPQLSVPENEGNTLTHDTSAHKGVDQQETRTLDSVGRHLQKEAEREKFERDGQNRFQKGADGQTPEWKTRKRQAQDFALLSPNRRHDRGYKRKSPDTDSPIDRGNQRHKDNVSRLLAGDKHKGRWRCMKGMDEIDADFMVTRLAAIQSNAKTTPQKITPEVNARQLDQGACRMIDTFNDGEGNLMAERQVLNATDKRLIDLKADNNPIMNGKNSDTR